MKTVIIGGVAGGMAAATRLRRLDETAEIVAVLHHISTGPSDVKNSCSSWTAIGTTR